MTPRCTNPDCGLAAAVTLRDVPWCVACYRREVAA